MMKQRFKFESRWIGAVVSIILLLGPAAARAQTFESGSDGSDGALVLTTPGTIDFDPIALGLDADGDHIFHFTTINVAADVNVRLSARHFNGPVFWLASGDVLIDGTIDLNGEGGQSRQDILDQNRLSAVPGAGGFGGGLGSSSLEPGTPGLGPGGGGSFQGATSSSGIAGGGAGHTTFGSGGFSPGPPYGNNFLVPLVGGSGGGGSTFTGQLGAGGGAGGGAILIASSTSISVGSTGRIQADGGGGGSSSFRHGGNGSGGSIHLLAPTITVAGALRASGGSTVSVGRIRIEAFERSISGSIGPLPFTSAPVAVFLPETPPAALRVVSVDGIPVASNPTGSFTMPDVTVNNAEPVDVVIEARNIPLGTIVQLHLLSATEVDQVVDSTPLVGTNELSSATATATFPHGFSRGFVRATFGPPPSP